MNTVVHGRTAHPLLLPESPVEAFAIVEAPTIAHAYNWVKGQHDEIFTVQAKAS